MKKIFPFFIFLFLIFSQVNALEPRQKAYVKGPMAAPPTMEELKKERCRDPEFANSKECLKVEKKQKKNFFELIWEWILSLFK